MLTATAVFLLGLSVFPRAPVAHRALRRIYQERLARHRARLLRARLRVDPRVFEALSVGAPVLGLLLGWAASPVIGVAAMGAGVALPRLLVGFLTARQRTRSEREAPQLLQLLLANLGAGSTYLEALQAARRNVTDGWLGEDLGYVVKRFLLNVPMEAALREVRPRIVGRNLGLVWDNLTICVEHKIPAERARDLLLDISTTVRFNVQLAGEIRAQTSGQRVQIWVLALLVPAIYLYLRLVSPYFLNVLDDTWTGRFVLLPAAAFLEVLGIYLSFRLSQVRI